MDDANGPLRLSTSPFWLDNWFVEPRSNQIRSGNRIRRLEPKTMEVLVYLSQRAGEVVTRDELLDAIWKDTFVSENTLSRTVSRLRKALGEDWQHPRYLETVSKSGYRLLVPVQEAPPDDPGTGASPQIAPSHPSSWFRNAASRTIPTGVLLLILSGWLWFLPADSDRLHPEFTPVVTLLGQQMATALSPDGANLAFGWQGPQSDNWDVYLQAPGADNPVRLTDSEYSEGFPVFSADGQTVIFARAAQSGCMGFFRKSVAGGDIERLADCPNSLQDLAWSPDESLLAFSTQPDRTAPRGIQILDLSSGDLRQLTTPPRDSMGDRDPMFSPDGQQIAFRRRRTGGRHNLYRIPLTGGTSTAVTKQQWGVITGHDWTRDGRSLIYATDRSGRMELQRVGIKGDGLERLPVADIWPTWPKTSRTSDRLVYRRIVDVTDLWSMELDAARKADEKPVRVAASTRSEMNPSLSATAQRVAFTSNRTGAFEVWSSNLEGTDLIRHTQLRGPSVHAPQWSPDGKWLLFDAYDRGHGDVFRVASGSRNPTRLIDGPTDDRNAFYSRNGQWIYFASNRSGGWEIWRIPSEGGEPTQITTTGAFRAQEGPDGLHLYYAKLDNSGLWKFSLESREARQVLEKVGRWEWGNWSVRRSGIYFIQRGPTAIAHYDFGEERIVTLAKLPKTVQYLTPSFWVAEDESRVIYTQISQSDDELILAEQLGL